METTIRVCIPLTCHFICELNIQKYCNDEFSRIMICNPTDNKIVWQNIRRMIDGLDVQLHQYKYYVTHDDYESILKDILNNNDHSNIAHRAIEILNN